MLISSKQVTLYYTMVKLRVYVYVNIEKATRNNNTNYANKQYIKIMVKCKQVCDSSKNKCGKIV